MPAGSCSCGRCAGSRSTFHVKQLDRLEALVSTLERWQKAINLVGKTTLDDVWRRHVLDSAQLKGLIPDGAKSLADLGSGAGFPGLVLAALRPRPRRHADRVGRPQSGLPRRGRAAA